MTVLVVVTHDGAATAALIHRTWRHYGDLRVLSDGDLDDVLHDRSLHLVVVATGEDTDAGHRACRAVRASGPVPLCLVTQSRREADELLAFARGVDDYLTTRFSPEVMRARLEALAARGDRLVGSDSSRFGCLEVDVLMRRVTVHGVEIPLTRTEFDLLHALVTEQRRVVSRWELVERGWGGGEPREHVLDVHMSRLRRKVLAAGGPKLGEPVPGLGYRVGTPTCPSEECGDRPAGSGSPGRRVLAAAARDIA